MRKDLTRADPTKPDRQKPTDAASSLKGELMADAVGRLLGKDESTAASDNEPPRVILALANHGRSPGWDHAKVLQQQMFDAAAGTGLEMKFAFYGPDDAAGVRRCRITARWITNADEMSGLIDRAECNCGCYVHIRDVLAQAVKEAGERPLRAVIILGDAFHDDEDGLYEAAISASELRRVGTQVFLMQLGDDPITARKLKWIKTVSGGAYFRFDPRAQQQQFSEMWQAVSVYAAGGEEAVKMTSGQAATLLLEHLKQKPMSIIEERDRVRVDPDINE